MLSGKSSLDPLTFTTFGDMLGYLRRREQLTQRDLGIAVGYSEGHINRFEKNKRIPPSAVIAALFIPALNLAYDSPIAGRLIELSASSRVNPVEAAAELESGMTAEPIPPAPPQEIARPQVCAEVEARLAADRHIVLSGLPGMGKTTIASQIARRYAQSMPVFWLTFTQGISASADVLIRQLAVFLSAHGQNAVKPLFSMNQGSPAGIPLDLKLALLCSALTKLPALLCFDNAELIQQDETCLQILSHISVTTPAFILMISRQSLPLPAFAGLNLNGFEFDEGLAFVTHHSAAAIDEKQAERLVAKMEGCPMLLRLAVGKMANERGEVEQFITHLETQPQVLAYLFETIQKQLSSNGWRLLLLLAAFQQPLNLYDAHLVEMALTQGEIDPMSEAISELQRRQLIVNAAYAQLHPLIWGYVNRALRMEVHLHQRLHRLAADWFWVSHQDALSAVLHYNQAGLLEQAVDMAEENQILIIGRGQAMAAVEILDEVQSKIQGLRSIPGDLLRRLLVARGMLLVGTLRVDEGESNLRQAIAMTATPALRAYTQARLAEMRLLRSDYQEAHQLIQSARSELTPQDVLLRARLAGLESIAHSATGRPGQSADCANESLTLAGQLTGIPSTLIGEIQGRAQLQLADGARIQRDLNASMRHAQAALQSARRAQHRRMTNLCLSFIGGLHFDLGDLNLSFRFRQEGLEGLLAIGDVHSAAYSLTQLADIHHLRLEIDQALEKLGQANETLLAVGDMRGLAASEALRTTCLLWNGQVEKSRAVILHLLEVARGKGTERLWGYRLSKLAMVQMVNGELEAAFATLQQALDLPSAAENRMMRFNLQNQLALAHTAGGDHKSAWGCLENNPRSEGLSRWVEFDRDLIEGYAAIGGGDLAAGEAIWQQVARRAAVYPLYGQMLAQMATAIRQPVPPSAYPRLLWVRSDPQSE
jgi:ATP/maltotriose-dependent transcriptional regulator MalT